MLRVEEQPVDLVLHRIHDAAAARRNHRHAAGHRLQRHQPKRFGRGREDKRIRRTIRRDQLGPAQIPGKNRRRAAKMLFEILMAGAAADHRQPDSRLRKDRLAQHLQALLRRLSPHVDHQKVVGVTVRQPSAHGLVARAGRKQIGVDPAPPPTHTLKTLLDQVAPHRGGRAQVYIRRIVNVPHIRPQQRRAKSPPIMRGIARHIGVERGQRRHAQPPGEKETKRSQEKGVDHMHNIRLKITQPTPYKRPRHAHLQLRIKGQRQPAHTDNLGSGILRRTPFGAEQQHLVPLLLQAAQHQGQNTNDTVDLGQECLRKNGDPQLLFVRCIHFCFLCRYPDTDENRARSSNVESDHQSPTRYQDCSIGRKRPLVRRVPIRSVIKPGAASVGQVPQPLSSYLVSVPESSIL